MPRLARILAGVICAGALVPGAAAGAAGSPLAVVADHLNQPKKLTLAPNGDLVVALSGTGTAPSSCRLGIEASCLNASGAIDRVTPTGHVKQLLGGLPSVPLGGAGANASGPSEALYAGGRLDVLYQDVNIDQTNGRNHLYGPAADVFGDLLRYSGSLRSHRVVASFGPFEAANNPDQFAGSDVAYGTEEGFDSDPYSFVPYRGGFAVADAAANDLLYVAPGGTIYLLAVFATIPEYAPAGTYGAQQTEPITAQAQPVPDTVAVGSDGALYVGELVGVPFAPGQSAVYRVIPGRPPTLFASGFTAIADIAFRRGRLLVLELDHKGLADPGLAHGRPADGALLALSADGRRRQLIASRGLTFPTALAVTPRGTVYVSDFGVSNAGARGHGGEIVRVRVP
jgi:hypothetical protein